MPSLAATEVVLKKRIGEFSQPSLAKRKHLSPLCRRESVDSNNQFFSKRSSDVVQELSL